MEGLPGAPEGGPGGEVGLEDVGRLTELFPGSTAGTLGAHGDDGPCSGNCCWGTFKPHHNRLGGSHILASVAHILDIIGLHWWLVGNCVPC